MQRTFPLSLACQAVSEDTLCPLTSGTCTSALLLLSPSSVLPKADLEGNSNSKPQFALLELWFHPQNFVSKMGQTQEEKHLLVLLLPRLPQGNQIFLLYLQTRKGTWNWMLHYMLKNGCSLMQNTTVVYSAFETKSASDVAKWELLTEIKQTLKNWKFFKFWRRITLYLRHKNFRSSQE